jgi:hypothetical protein
MILTTVRNVIDELDGLEAVAALCDVDYRSVSRWQVEDACPPKYFVIMTAELAKRGFRAPERLWRMVEAAE